MLNIHKTLCCLCLFFALMGATPYTGHAKSPLFPHLKKTIVIDPGHGGADTGARGTDGTLEKNLTLTFSKSMQQSLHADYNVVLTRTGDYELDLTSRTETANRSGGHLLVSVHAGGNYIHESQGIIIYYYSRKDVGLEEESAGSPGESASSRGTPWNASQKKYSEISRGVALALKQQLTRNPNFHDVRVQGLPAYLLAGADMPAVLIELGYITNPLTESRLKDARYLSDFSGELCRGIADYFQTYTPSSER